MRKRLAFSLIFLWTLVLPAADGSRAENFKMRLAAIEAQLSSKKAAIRDAWIEVLRLDRLILQALPVAGETPQSLPEDSGSAADKVQSLLDLSFDRESLERRRQEALQGILADYREVTHLEDELQRTKSKIERSGSLDGGWALTMMPQGLKGEVFIVQSGVMLSGDYQMENGLVGSVQGTLVSSQVTLERIDSKYGKMGRFEGQVMKDGGRIQGTWYSYDILSGQALTGAFYMERVREEAPATPD